MQKFLKLLNFPLIILSFFLIRLLITGASIGDSIVLLGLSGLYGFYYHNESKKEPEINEEFKKKIAVMQNELDSIKNVQNTIKISSQIKPPANIRF